MLFNSYEFIFIFLPIVVIIYFFLNKKALFITSKIWLIIASLFFYAWWNVKFLPLIIVSIIVNYSIGRILVFSKEPVTRKAVIITGVCFNIGLLGYFKYADFFIANMNMMLVNDLPLLQLGLPLAISFFTFQQIAYIVDTYKKKNNDTGFLNYILFVSFFPQLIAGPIVHHKEIMPQFDKHSHTSVNYKNLAIGLFIFSIGLFKKVVLADAFAVWATEGFDQLDTLSFIEAWVVSLSYTFQLYFDFSGYMDMATGAALFFNIKLPINFNSPYKSLNIQEVWSRWHITLGDFLYRYIYFPLNKFLLHRVFTPLGLKQQVMLRTSVTLILLFLISGIWHGAGWTFVFWGLIHGLATVLHRYWKLMNIKMNKVLAWFLTFNFINFSLVFFRALSFEDAMKVLKGMLGFNGIVFPTELQSLLPAPLVELVTIEKMQLYNVTSAFQYIGLAFIIILCFKNTVQLQEKFKPTWYTFLFTFLLLLYAILDLTKASEFLYFNF